MTTSRPFEVRKDLADLPPYMAPQIDAPVRLNTNESPWPPPDSFVKEFAERVRTLAFNRYPERDARALRTGLGARHGWPSDGVWVANGSNEILQTVLLTFGGPGRCVLLFEPTYAMHSHIARVTGTAVVTKRLDPPWVLDRTSVAWAATFDEPAITFICSPNNPTGNAQPLDVVEAALATTRGLVVVDEAYGDFCKRSAVSLLAANDRLVVTRSFSKSWRLAGARIGYLLAHPWLIDALQVARLPYHLSALTQACGEVAIKHADAILDGVGEIVVARDRLAQELARVPGVETFPSDANFILFRTARDGDALWRALAEAGVLVRNFTSVIPGALRVTVGSGDENAAFVEALWGVMTDDG